MNATTDVLIIGSGIGGLITAIKCVEEGLDVTLVSREGTPWESNTYWAQGGIVYAKDDLGDGLEADIQAASSHTSSTEAIKILLKHSSHVLDEYLLKKSFTQFERNKEQELSLTKEAAHGMARILYAGDHTGKNIHQSLFEYLLKISKEKNKNNFKILTSHTAIDLIAPNHHGVGLNQRYDFPQIVGAYLFDQKNPQVIKMIAKKTVLATGGIGSLYLHHTNSDAARGDGHAMAQRAGAYMANMEFIQFHPTALYSPSTGRKFLISEALRGEGGVLLNTSGERFMDRYHPQAELAPRDVVTRSIVSEMLLDKSECVYLDVTKLGKEYLLERFPTIHQYCSSHNIDITKDLIPVVPAAHYACGGVVVDGRGRTSLSHLYAVGEVACTGLHGANRLASTSLLEALTWGHLAAIDITSSVKSMNHYAAAQIKDWELSSGPFEMDLVAQDLISIKQSMWNYVGIIRSRQRLSRAQAMFIELNHEVRQFYKNAKLHDQLIGLRNAVEVALMVVGASMKNRQSVGCFFLTQD
ncbi:MAG: FAD-binding protein [Bacteriovoracaceae bacterium]|nr:FAD-binding protein [Bacteriovoracaceae bacterium]